MSVHRTNRVDSLDGVTRGAQDRVESNQVGASPNRFSVVFDQRTRTLQRRFCGGGGVGRDGNSQIVITMVFLLLKRLLLLLLFTDIELSLGGSRQYTSNK